MTAVMVVVAVVMLTTRSYRRRQDSAGRSVSSSVMRRSEMEICRSLCSKLLASYVTPGI